MTLEIEIEFPVQARDLAHRAIERRMDPDETATYLLLAASHMEKQAEDVRGAQVSVKGLERVLKTTQTNLERADEKLIEERREAGATCTDLLATIEKQDEKIARLKRRENSAFLTVRQNLKDARATCTAQQERIRELRHIIEGHEATALESEIEIANLKAALKNAPYTEVLKDNHAMGVVEQAQALRERMSLQLQYGMQHTSIVGRQPNTIDGIVHRVAELDLIEKLQTEIAALKQQDPSELAQSTMAVQRALIEELKAERDRLKGYNDSLINDVQNAEEEIAHLKRQDPSALAQDTMLLQRARIEELEGYISPLRTELDEEIGEIVSLKRHIEEIQQANKSAVATIIERETTIRNQLKMIGAHQRAYTTRDGEIAALMEDNHRLIAQVEGNVVDGLLLEKVQKTLLEQQAHIVEIEQRNKRQSATIGKHEGELHRAAQQVEEHDREVHRQRKEIELHIAKIERLESEPSADALTMQRLEERNNNQAHTIDQYIALLKAQTQTMEELTEEKAKDVQRIEVLKRHNSNQAIAFNMFRAEIIKLEKTVEALTAENAEKLAFLQRLEKLSADATIVQERETVVTGRTIERLEGQVRYKDGQITRFTAETLAQEERLEVQRKRLKNTRKLIKAKDKTIIKLARLTYTEDAK